MKHNQAEPSEDEQRAAFAAEWAARNGPLNGRHKEKAPRKRYARRPGPPGYFRGILPTSGRGRLLEAARALQDRQTIQKAFGLSALVLTAWEMFPADFGLPGVERQHPSDNAVRCLLYGQRGLICRGLIEKLGDGLMRVASPPG